MKEIRGQAKNIRGLLQNARFGIDYFQREYRWEEKQVAEALDDLTGTFRTSQERHGKSRDVADHDRYFLGSIVVSESAGRRFIADGQQRLTTVTLFLIALYRRPAGRPPAYGPLAAHLLVPRGADLLEPRRRGSDRVHGGAVQRRELRRRREVGVGDPYRQELRIDRGEAERGARRIEAARRWG